MEKEYVHKKRRKTKQKLTEEEIEERRKKKNEDAWKDVLDYKSQLRNPKFEFYYKNQLSALLPEEATFKAFLEKLKEKLPCVFRVNKAHGFAKAFLQLLNSEKFIDNFTAKFNEQFQVKIEKQILTNFDEWKDLIFKINLPRFVLKKSISLNQFHKFLQNSVDSGLISRQEAVSMIPPMLLRVQRGDRVFDMCAAPGSKTAQFLESFYEHFDYFNKDDFDADTGCVLANDSNAKRAFMMVHQLKRLNTAGMIVITHNAEVFPTLYTNEGTNERVLFDKILADVPCTGDAVMRKLPNKWKNWSTKDAYSLHKIQLQILKRALTLLKVGGTMIYSTCSLSPIENEATIAAAMKQFSQSGELEIVDLKEAFKDSDIKPHNGLLHWKMYIESKKDKKQIIEIKDINDDNYQYYKDTIDESCFPPTLDEAKKFKLHNCVRLLPHDSDTSGFFITMIKKNKPILTDTNKAKSCVLNEDIYEHKKDYGFLHSKYPESLQKLIEYYGIDEGFPSKQLFLKSKDVASKIAFISKGVYDFLCFDKKGQLKVENAGVKIFEKHKCKTSEGDYCAFRVCQDGLMYVLPFMHKRVVFTNTENIKILLQKNEVFVDEFTDKKLCDVVKNMDIGCGVLVNVKDSNKGLTKDNFIDGFCCFFSKRKVCLMIGQEHKHVFKLKYGIDIY